MKRWGFCGLAFIVATLVLIWPLAGPAWADSTWVCDPNTAGDWNDPNNWSPNVPGAGNNACIDNGGTASISGGSINVNYLYDGNSFTGSINQSGGTNIVGHTFYLGYRTGSHGTYSLSDGSLNTGKYEYYVGYEGTGTFLQSGGTYTTTGDLYLGYQTGSSGTYTLSGGSLGTKSCSMARNGDGAFIQTGGTYVVTNALSVGEEYYGEGNGTYNLSGGSLRTGGCNIVSDAGTMAFNQSGGTHTVEGELNVESSNVYHGSVGVRRYNLSDGLLSISSNQCVGKIGVGIFNQSGGTNSVGGSLYVGGSISDGSYGVYELTGGSLTVAGSIVLTGGEYGTAEFYLDKAAYVRAGGLVLNASYWSSFWQFTKMSMEIDADGHSLIQTTGSATLAGLLDLQSLHSYRPNQGDTFTLITSTDMSGNFGIITSNLVNTDPNRNVMGLLIRDANATDPNLKYWSAFRGAAVGTNYVVTFQGAMAGDATANNVVDGSDFGAMARNWGQSGKIWTDGDFNGDGTVDSTDFGAMARNWGLTGLTPAAAPMDAPIPEPAILVLLTTGSLALLRRRRAAPRSA